MFLTDIFCVQIAADENALQFLNETAMSGVQAFLSNPVKNNLSRLVHCPAFYKVADWEFSMDSNIDKITLAVFRLVYVRAYIVLGQLTKYDAPAASAIPIRTEDQWMKVSFVII